MSEDSDKKLDFSLPARAPTPSPNSGRSNLVLFLLLILVGGNLYLTWRGPEASPQAAGKDGGLATEELKQLALKMEKQGLSRAAAGAWKEYLASAEKETEPSAIWYRIGTLYQAVDEHELALAAFYRSESLGGKEELASETGRKVQDSLEALGKFAALKHELTERVGLNENAGEQSGEVLAEIGAQKITRMELDRQIEALIENQLGMMAGQLTPEQRKQQKAAMLQQFSGDQQRLQFLNSYIVQEILYRKARALKLTENPSVRAQLREAERSLLARQVMDSEMKRKILISETDVAGFFAMKKEDYFEPAWAALSHIVVADEETAKQVIARILAGEEFAELARELSTDAATKDKGGEIAGRVVSGRAIPGIKVEAAALVPLFAAKEGDILGSPLIGETGSHVFQLRKLTPGRQQSLEEVRSQIHAQLRRDKEREVQAQLLESLREEYDVVIHHDAFAAPAPKE
jgi:parvulin-like peptidyl-prolyl isomerase